MNTAHTDALRRVREYGSRGRLGIGVPQANSTVEPELRRLLPEDVAFYSVRLYSSEADEARRIAAYLENLPDYLLRYDTLALDGFGFAITGATYLLGSQAEQAIIERAERRFGYRVITTAGALGGDLKRLGARRIQLLSPYPAFLTEAARRYWQSLDIEVVRIVNVGNPAKRTHDIYALSSAHALEALEREPGHDVDAVVCSGTGLPTIGLLAGSAHLCRAPLLTSTLSLTNALLGHLGLPSVDPSVVAAHNGGGG